jgi:hypothetical protein
VSVAASWLHRWPSNLKAGGRERIVILRGPDSFRLSDEQRQLILLRTGHQPEESLRLLLEQIRNGRPLFRD